jgi:hypothetical protein
MAPPAKRPPHAFYELEARRAPGTRRVGVSVNSGEGATQRRPHRGREAMQRRGIAAVAAILALAAGSLGVKMAVDAQRPTGTDEEQIRRLLVEGESAVERRDAAGVNRLISENYRDGMGFSDTSVKYQIKDYLRGKRAIEVQIPSESVDVRVDAPSKTATARFHVSTRMQAAAGSPVPTELDLGLTLAKERVYYYWVFPGEEWKVTSAEGYGALEGL